MNRSFVAVVVLVGALLSGTASAYAVPTFVANDDQACLIKVTAAPTVAENRFGSRVALSHETLVVAADGNGAEDSGMAAYVFVRSSEGWTQQQKISFAAGEETQAAGEETQPRSIAIDGDTMAVGLPGEIQVWVRTAWVWRLQARLTEIGRDYVESIAIEGDTLVAGASMTGPDAMGENESTAGAAHVFVRTGETWSLRQTLRGSATSPYARFGTSVDIQGDTLAVGAMAENAPARGAGAVYVFRLIESEWQQESRLTIPGAAEFASLGGNVQLDGDQLATSMFGWASQTGAVYIWDRSGGSWVASGRITAPDGRPGYLRDYGGDSFGSGMALAGDTLIVGAPEDDDKGSNSGSVYVLKKVEDSWVFLRKLVTVETAPGALFGMSLAVDSGRVAVGMPRDSAVEESGGSVRAFDLGVVTPVGTTVTIDAADLLANDIVPELVPVAVVPAAAPAHGELLAVPGNGFSYAPSGGWKGADRFTYGLQQVGIAAATVGSGTATVTVETWQPTALKLGPVGATPAYLGSQVLKAVLLTRQGAPVAGRTVVFEVLSGTLWKSVGSVVTGPTGAASVKVAGSTTRRSYRVRTGWSTLYGAAGSGSLSVVPHVSLSALSSPSTVRRRATLTASGTLKPRHTAGSNAVELRYYRWESGSWKLKKSVLAKARNYSSYSKFSFSTSLTQTGRWMVRVRHAADSSNAETWGRPRYFTVS